MSTELVDSVTKQSLSSTASLDDQIEFTVPEKIHEVFKMVKVRENVLWSQGVHFWDTDTSIKIIQDSLQDSYALPDLRTINGVNHGNHIDWTEEKFRLEAKTSQAVEWLFQLFDENTNIDILIRGVALFYYLCDYHSMSHPPTMELYNDFINYKLTTPAMVVW